MPLTDDGFVALRADEFLTVIRAEYVSRTGLEVDFEADVFLGVITAIMSDLLGQLSEEVQAIFDARDPGNATGTQLSSLALAVGITRRDATFSTASVDLTGDAGTIIVQGRTVRSGGETDSQLWDTTADVTLDGGGLGTVIAQAQTPGAIRAAAGEIDQIVTAVLGWQTVTNPLLAIAGLDRETDDELRLRRQDSLQISGSTSADAMRAQLIQVEGVQTAIVVENDDTVAILVDTVSIGPHSVAVIIHPPTLTDAQKEAVAETIFNTLAIGIATNGTDVIATVTGADNLPKTIRFDFTDNLLVDTGVTVTVEPEVAGEPKPPTFAEIKPQVETAVTAFYAALQVGVDVRKLPLLSDLNAIEGIRSVIVGLDTAVDPGSRLDAAGDVTVFINELAIEDTTIVVEAP